MRFGRIYLDTNVFIRAFEGALDDIVAQNLLDIFRLSGKQDRPVFATSQLTLAEALVEPIRSGDAARQLRYKLLLSRSGSWLDVVPITRLVLESAARLRAMSRLKLLDAIHVATAREVGCNHILTGDADFGETALGLDARTTAAILDWLRS